MKRELITSALAMALAVALGAQTEADDRPRLGVSVIDTSNSAGVIVTQVKSGSAAAHLRRVDDREKLQLEPRAHAITHVNGVPVADCDSFLTAVSTSPRDATFRVYTYATAEWDDYSTRLHGNPVARAVVDYQPEYNMQYQTYESQRRNERPRESAKKKRSFFNWGNYPEGDDWRPGDHTWWFQKKPTDPELRKAYRRQTFAELLVGVAAGLDGASEAVDNYPSYSTQSSGSSRGLFGGSRDSFNRNYSTNPDHAPVFGW